MQSHNTASHFSLWAFLRHLKQSSLAQWISGYYIKINGFHAAFAPLETNSYNNVTTAVADSLWGSACWFKLHQHCVANSGQDRLWIICKVWFRHLCLCSYAPIAPA